MTMIKNTATTRPPSTTSRRTTFLGCFGFSGEKKMHQIDHKVNSGSPRHHGIFQWSFGCKKSTKTVHVDFNTVNRRSKSVNNAPVKADTWEIQVVEEDKALTKKHVIMVTSEEPKTCRKKWTDVVKRQNGSSCAKEMKQAATSAVCGSLESLENKSVTIAEPLVSAPLKPLTNSKSLPVNSIRHKPLKESLGKKSVAIAQPLVSSPVKPLTNSKSLPANSKRQKPPKAPMAGGGLDEGVARKTMFSSGGEFDSIIAMSILLVILMIMVLWGKLCAIICTCAWFSVAPRLVATRERVPVATGEMRLPELEQKLNLESVEYKKKVVLEGLLQRNHRNVVGRL